LGNGLSFLGNRSFFCYIQGKVIPEYTGSSQEKTDGKIELCQTLFARGKLRLWKNGHQSQHFLCKAEAGNHQRDKPDHHRSSHKKTAGNFRKQKSKRCNGSKPDGKP